MPGWGTEIGESLFGAIWPYKLASPVLIATGKRRLDDDDIVNHR